MAITQAIANSFKQELLGGEHDFDSGADVFKLALYQSDATLNSSTTSYTSTNECPASGQYALGGGTLTGQTTALSSGVAYVDFADLSFTGVTLTARGALIYNTSATNTLAAVAILDFGADKTATSGTFTIQFPDANDTQAIIRIGN